MAQFRYNAEYETIASGLLALAKSNYEIHFEDDQSLDERCIFPTSPNETNGIEDARFVQFTDDNGEVTYYATYTAYNGKVTFPQLLETKDFTHFSVSTLNGAEVSNKGMALFPRKDQRKIRHDFAAGRGKYLHHVSPTTCTSGRRKN